MVDSELLVDKQPIPRTIYPNFTDNPNDRTYVSNKISTTKYTLLNFLPLTILLQFSRIANVFYLVNAILQTIPSISTNDPLATIIPLVYVVSLGILKEFLADYKRYKNDNKVNETKCHKLNEQGQIVVCRTDQIKVGDVLRIHDDEIIPADCVVLACYQDSYDGDVTECFTKT